MEKQVGKSGEFWKDKKVFVTGATGFKGTWLVKALVEAGAKVTCLAFELPVNSNFVNLRLDKKTNMVFGNIKDKELLKQALYKYKIDTIFHLAAQPLVQAALKNPIETFETNIEGTWNLLEVSRLYGGIKRFVFASSDKAYGVHDKLPYDEECALQGSFPYDVSKSCADLLAQTYAKTYDLPVVISRMENVYGGGDLNFDRIMPETIKHILNDEEILIRSDGQFTRGFFYVEDSAAAYMSLAENLESKNLKGESFNFGYGEPIKIIDMVNLIIKISGKPADVKILNEVKAEIRDQYLSVKKAKEILGFKPLYGFETGLKETYNWYKNYFGK